jgi:hypothetical protein
MSKIWTASFSHIFLKEKTKQYFMWVDKGLKKTHSRSRTENRVVALLFLRVHVEDCWFSLFINIGKCTLSWLVVKEYCVDMWCLNSPGKKKLRHWHCCLTPNEECSSVTWWDQLSYFWWDDDGVCFVLNQLTGIYMSLHSNTLDWFCGKQSLLSLSI